MIEWVMFMKKYSEFASKGLKLLVLIIIVLMCMTQTRLVGGAVSDGINRCLTVVIPSLFAMTAVSGIIVSSGITSCVPNRFSRMTQRIFGIDGSVLPIFIIGQFAGYPVGTSMLLTEYSEGRLSKRHTEILSGLCFGAGPAFIFGCISGQLYSSSAAGIIIAVSCMAANILALLVLSPFLRKGTSQAQKEKCFSLTADTVTESIISSGNSMFRICFTIMAFSVISAFSDFFGISTNAGRLLSRLTDVSADTGTKLFSAFLDVTNVSGLPHNDHTLLPMICVLTSFGGICVIFQLAALTSGKLSIKPLLLTRAVISIASGVICRLVMPFFLRHELTAASAVNFHLHKEVSPIPSIMLIIMTVMLFVSYNDTVRRE